MSKNRRNDQIKWYKNMQKEVNLRKLLPKYFWIKKNKNSKKF